ncbi:hypothetical protein KIN20_012665 [Parelaphostrongylus tenuis]|uniref:Uncharacterized protein n=1 Tax=Parelaphostrongylus tenuis TaxID=148309 RepID=A0AAD5MWJ9_PARTN|nr:hypothetical protein KIN20_012665 [Parelaphostrongylus tenuis]
MSRSVAIPLRDSLEDEKNLKQIRRFSVEVWNVTQNWVAISSRSLTIVERLVNNKLRIIYAKQNSEQSLSASDAETFVLDKDARHRVINEIIRDAEELSESVQGLRRIVSKLETAKSRIEAWMKLCPNPGPIVANILGTLADIVPALIRMYDCEVTQD